MINLNGNTGKGKLYAVSGSSNILKDQFDFTTGQWQSLQMIVNLDLKRVRFELDSIGVYEDDWKSGDGIFQNNLEAYNLWSKNEALGFTPEMYIDDFCFQAGSWSSGIEELDEIIHFYPNPSNGSIRINHMKPFAEELFIFDLRGVQVGSYLLSEEKTYKLNLSLAKGLYVLRLGDTSSRLIIR